VKIEFEPKDDESNSTEENESKEEVSHTSLLRRSVREKTLPERYIPPNVRSNFLLLMMILELLGRQRFQRMENSGKGPWLKKWQP
jgi:hypothetical protein